MTKDKKKKKDVKNDSLLVTDEKWRGLENKFWTVVEFGYYTILIVFTIYAVGFRTAGILNRNVIIDTEKHLEDNNTIYYNLSKYCTDLNNCSINNEITNNNGVNLAYVAQDGVGTLNFNGKNVVVSPVNELAILDNGYVATFTIGDINSINYYSSNGELIKTFATKLNSSGRLDSNTGVYAVCNSKKLEIAKYTIKDDGEFVEELMGNYNSDQC